jgi:hypothetical protein
VLLIRAGDRDALPPQRVKVDVEPAALNLPSLEHQRDDAPRLYPAD